jgi:hypothetical protein
VNQTAKCWGDSSAGALGNNMAGADSLVPVQVQLQ